MADNKGDVHRGDVLDATFLQADVGPYTSVWISLHTATLTSASLQNTSEATFGGYTRLEIACTGAEWQRTGNEMVNVNEIRFPDPTDNGGGEIVTDVMVGSSGTGTGKNLYYNALLSGSITIEVGSPVVIKPGQLKARES